MPSHSETIITKGLADELAYRLQRKILAGEYPPGSHLPQDEICRTFGVSRTPVREALRKLQAQNLVVVVPNKGAKVRVLTREELIEVYMIRAELEAFSCELAAPHLTDAGWMALKAAQRALGEAVDQFESSGVGADEEAAFSRRLNKANEEFHYTIHRAAGNNYLLRMIEEVQQFFPKDYIWQAVRMAKGLRELNIKEHCKVIDALLAGDPVAVRREMKAHVLHAGTALVDYLDKQNFWK